MQAATLILILIFSASCGRHINTRYTDTIISVEKSLDYREGFAHGSQV